jgi:hypothetical protein
LKGRFADDDGTDQEGGGKGRGEDTGRRIAVADESCKQKNRFLYRQRIIVVLGATQRDYAAEGTHA